MKYAVLDRGDELSRKLTTQLHQLAAERGLVINHETPDIVVSIGGDGTMLQAFHQYKNQLDSIGFVGIHTGHLGFYADWKADEIEDLVHEMSQQHDEVANPRRVNYPLIELTITYENGVEEKHIALNEFTIKSIDTTIVAQIDINDELFEMFRGDGICISTPSGSTAYNKSLGGAMIHPTIAAIQLAEIASINNRVFRTLGSPIVLPKHHHFDIYSRKKQRLLLTIDHVNIPIENLHAVRCRVADETVSFVRYRPFPFWNRVREAFLGYDVERK